MPPPPYSRGQTGFNRRSSRSPSPSQKRSWLPPSDRQRRQRSPPPPRHGRLRDRSPSDTTSLMRNRSPSPMFKGRPPQPSQHQHQNPLPPRKDFRSPSPEFHRSSPHKGRSRSPRPLKRPKWQPPNEAPASQSRHQASRRRSRDFRPRSRSRSRSRHRSLSPRPPPKGTDSGRSHKGRKIPYPDDKFAGPPLKKKSRQMSPVSPRRRRAGSRSPEMNFSMNNSRVGGLKPSSSSTKFKDPGPPSSRKVNASTKKKAFRMTLHRRFTMDDHERFELDAKDNVTIAILRNPSAKPSEEVTVKRIFDASQFKMIHKKHEGRRPIFDREEIKIWRHDENFTDDPDFERRLIRVKSSGQKVGESLTRMSPDVLRKAFGLNLSRDRSHSRSPQREQQIRLDPRPDPRFEARYRKRDENEVVSRSSLALNKGPPEENRRRVEGRKEERRESGKRANRDESYDLRHALERRRSDREDSGFHVEHRRESDLSPEVFQRRGQRHLAEDDRNVVFNHRQMSTSFDDGFDSRRGKRGGRWRGDGPRGGFGGRSRGGGRGGNRFRENWSPERISSDEESWDIRRPPLRKFDSRRGGRSSESPPGNRDWRGRGAGFRGRGRGSGSRDFDDDRARDTPPRDEYFKYSQHDDRDVSPRGFRGRGGRGSRRIARGFGSKSFRVTRGGLRGTRGPRGGFFPRGRGRGGAEAWERERDGVRPRDMSSEREWKHDMYDSLQKDEGGNRATSPN